MTPEEIEKLKEEERIKRLTDGFHQMTEEFKVWVNGDFKQLDTKVEELVTSTEGTFKLLDDLVVLTAKVAERSKELLLKIKYKDLIDREVK